MEWKDSSEEALNMIPDMENAGWTVKFDHWDVIHKRIFPEIPSIYRVTFWKGEAGVWSIIDRERHISVWKKNSGGDDTELFDTLKELLASEKLLQPYSAIEI